MGNLNSNPMLQELPEPLTILICQYAPEYALIYSTDELNWHKVTFQVFGSKYDKSISSSEVKSTYTEKCVSEKIVPKNSHTVTHTVTHLISSESGGAKLIGSGRNNFGQLGMGDNIYRAKFEEIKGVPQNISEIIQGKYHTVIKLCDGRLWVSGDNEHGQLGLGDFKHRYKFEEIKSAPKNISRVICGARSTSIILDDGSLLRCGKNNYGELGTGDNLNKNTFQEIKHILGDIDKVVESFHFTIIKLTDGTLLSCGYNENGQLGHGDDLCRNVFTEIKSIPKNIADVVCSDTHIIIRLTSGTLMSCGSNIYGQLGHSDYKSRNSFELVTGISSRVSQISCGDSHTMIKTVDTSGMETLWACGDNSAGELGLGDTICRTSFCEIKSISAKNVSEISCCNGYTLIELYDTTLMSSGYYFNCSKTSNNSNIFTIVCKHA